MIRSDKTWIILCGALAVFAAGAEAKTIYVDNNLAGGQNDGTSWQNAFSELSVAMFSAAAGDEIWVASGVYSPTLRKDGFEDGLMNSTFLLRYPNVGVYGGFRGTQSTAHPGGETERGQRDYENHVTILDGQTYVLSIVTVEEGADQSTVLDGFTLTGGTSRNGSHMNESRGGGVFVNRGSVTVRNCVFRENYGNQGGAMYTQSSGPDPVVVYRCRFIGNGSGGTGGAVDMDNATFLNCEFIGNRADGGGGAAHGSNLTFINCLFSANSSDGWGGAVESRGGLTMINCAVNRNKCRVDSFEHNERYLPGGGLYGGPTDIVINSIFWENLEHQALYSDARYQPGEIQIGYDTGGEPPVIQYSAIQGGFAGEGNINLAEDPFIESAGERGFQSGLYGESGIDLRLKPEAPPLNAGSNGAVPPDEYDIDGDGDTGEPVPDLDGEPRIPDEAVDMGPYESVADCDGDGVADDFAIANDPSLDCNGNGVLDLCELDPARPQYNPESRDCNVNGIPDSCEDIAVACPGVGSELAPPPDALADSVPLFDENQAFIHPSDGNLYAKAPGNLRVEWAVEGGSRIEIYPIDLGASAALYVTDAPPQNAAPPVDLTPVIDRGNRVVFHYNSVIVDENDAWLDEINRIRASKAGYVLLEYRDRNGMPARFEAVDIRLNAPVPLEAVAGRALAPSRPENDDGSCMPIVSSGLNVYAWMQNESGPTQWRVFPVRTTDPIEPSERTEGFIEVYWRKAAGEVCWHTELARYTVDWPDQPQYNLWGPAGAVALPAVTVPGQTEIRYQFPGNHATPVSSSQLRFNDPGPGGGWATLLYRESGSDGLSVVFEVVRTVRHETRLEETTAAIGGRIEDPAHDPNAFPVGYIYSGNNFDPLAYIPDPDLEGDPEAFQTAPDSQFLNRRKAFFETPADEYPGDRAIIPVNAGPLVVWWYQISNGTRWPYKATYYDCVWPAVPDDCIILSNERGVGPFEPGGEAPRTYLEREIYWRGTAGGDPSIIGFNPNEEHADFYSVNLDGGRAETRLFAARDDLGMVYGRSEPFVLLRYKRETAGGGWEWDYDTIRVARTPDGAPGCECDEGPCGFQYNALAGTPLRHLRPLSFTQNHSPLCAESTIADPAHVWDDGKGGKWFRRGGITAAARYFERWRGGGCLPWLISDPNNPVPLDVLWDVAWPANPVPPEQAEIRPDFYTPMAYGQTRYRNGLQRIEILYNEAGVKAYHALRESLAGIDPNDIPSDFLQKTKELPPHISARFGKSFDDRHLFFRGIQQVPGDTNSILHGIMSEDERDTILEVFADAGAGMIQAVNDLFEETGNQAGIIDDPGEKLENDQGGVIAITAGAASAEGWCTIGINGHEEGKPDGLSAVEIFKVECPLEPGRVLPVYPRCPLETEEIALVWSGDCAGDCGRFEFYWEYAPGARPDYEDIDTGGGAGSVESPWQPWVHDDGATGWVPGRNQVVVSGRNRSKEFVMSDNWFRVKVRVPPDADPIRFACPPGTESPWTREALAEGWLKRAKRFLNPADQLIQNFRANENEVNTYVQMIQLAGPPASGIAPLTCDPEILNQRGFIQLYQAVMDRGRSFTLDQGVNYQPANQGLLLIASTLADLHLLLGNEAYQDAVDPTIGLDSENNPFSSTVFSFMDQFDSLLDEEMALLRGRDSLAGTDTVTYPVFNRMYWNMTDGAQGQPAYAVNYNLKDINPNAEGGTGDGFIDEFDARAAFPQGHGDAWGHYLSAVKYYYELLRDENFDWETRSEAVQVGGIGGTAVEVNYRYERKFAEASAARSRAAVDIVDRTYRQLYTDDPSEQWKGYPDPRAGDGRAWGVSDWASRAYMGAYFDWVSANAMLPDEDPDPSHEGTIRQVDRTTVPDLNEIAAAADEILGAVDRANSGLNPLGLAKNVIPFDISRSDLDRGLTHFEQIYGRAVNVLNNTVNVFDYANRFTQQIREAEETAQAFRGDIQERELDFKNRLIETLGYPYPEDTNPETGRTYGVNYDGPDLYHYDYVDVDELLGLNGEYELPAARAVGVTFQRKSVDDTGGVAQSPDVTVEYNVAPGFGLVKPREFTIPRRAPGEVQLARSDLVQTWWKLQESLRRYDNALKDIEDQEFLLQQRRDFLSSQVSIVQSNVNTQGGLDGAIFASKTGQLALRRIAEFTRRNLEAVVEGLPKMVGFSNDVAAPVRLAFKSTATNLTHGLLIGADVAETAELSLNLAKQLENRKTELELTKIGGTVEVEADIKKLQKMVRDLSELEVRIYSLLEAARQAAGRYQAAIARGARILEERTAFRKRTASQISETRYRDIAYRLFRNEALQKYHAQFDMASKFVMLAAKAYGYETNLLSFDTQNESGERLVSRIVRERNLGSILRQGSLRVPQSGPGLAGVLAELNENFALLKGPLGFNNPTVETNKFSLRRELFRIRPGDAPENRELWREQLNRSVVRDLRSELPEFNQLVSPFDPYTPPEPAIVIDFGTTIQSDLNFFGWASTLGGESFFPSDRFAHKIRGVGIWFSGYNDSANGLATTPFCYLIPAGADVLRVPYRNANALQKTREWSITDQFIPPPFDLGEGFRQSDWLPSEQLPNPLLQPAVRRHTSIRAYHDGGGLGSVPESEISLQPSLVGRSVWNKRWLLIIPGRFLLPGNPEEGIRRFIEGSGGDGGVSDIRIVFETYQYGGVLD